MQKDIILSMISIDYNSLNINSNLPTFPKFIIKYIDLMSSSYKSS